MKENKSDYVKRIVKLAQQSGASDVPTGRLLVCYKECGWHYTGTNLCGWPFGKCDERIKRK